MQGGYGERSEGRNRNESRDNWNEYDTDRDKWNEERDDPWNDRRYGGTTGSGNINHNKSHGDNGNFEGNNRGTPTRDYLDDSKESQNIRKEDSNSDAQNSADRESTRDRNHYQEMRGLRRSKPERERGDRDREW